MADITRIRAGIVRWRLKTASVKVLNRVQAILAGKPRDAERERADADDEKHHHTGSTRKYEWPNPIRHCQMRCWNHRHVKTYNIDRCNPA